MMNKTAFAISAILTAFLLAIVGGVVYTVRSVKSVDAANPASTQEVQADAQTEPVDTPLAQTLDQQTLQEIQQRETTYQSLIDQANERLVQAQQKQQELQAQLNALTAAATASDAAQAPAQEYVAPEAAALVAAQYLNQTSIYSVETSILKGDMVYKVVMSSGDIAYVSLDGQFIGVQPAPTPQPTTRTGTRQGGGGGYHDDHESEDHDD